MTPTLSLLLSRSASPVSSAHPRELRSAIREGKSDEATGTEAGLRYREGTAEVGEPPRQKQGPSGGNDGSGGDDRKLTFEEVHRKYQDKIYNLILRWVGDRDDAEDLTLETFTNAWRNWDRFRGDSKVSTWLYQIAANACKNRFKTRDRQRSREVMSLDDSIETDGGDMSREVPDLSFAPEKLLMTQELSDKIQEAIDALPSDYRVILILAVHDELSYEEIARITDLTVPAVKTRLHRARNRVQQRLEPYYRNWSGRNG